jgi:hypothetical protein
MTKETFHVRYPWVKAAIECNDGWLPLISALCERLQWYCNLRRVDLPEVRQIKEKFGALCFYIDPAHYNTKVGKGMYDIIGNYEAMSRFVCEECGTTVDVGWCNGWIRSICKPCFETVIKPRWPDRTWKSGTEKIYGVHTMEPVPATEENNNQDKKETT